MDESTRKLYELKAEVMSALAHPIRLMIIDCLNREDLPVGELAIRVGSERSNVSRHLAVLLKADVVENRKEGLHVVYRLKTCCVLGFMSCLSQVLRERMEGATALLKQL
jgi:ArsR family transcriptional regulator, arsenate/arsenite/antimonite-responsive transcriptional repressor